jgi:hypothetical protein
VKSGMVAMSRVDFNVIKISEGVSAGMSHSIYLSILKIKLRKEGNIMIQQSVAHYRYPRSLILGEVG